MKKTWLLVLLILLLQCALRLPFLAEPLNYDESVYMQIAGRMSQGEQLYRDIIDVKPPLLFNFYQLVGQEAQRLRLVMTVISLLTTLLVLQAGWLLGGQRVGLAAAGLFAVFSGGIFVEGTLGSPEGLMLPLLVGALNGLILGGGWIVLAGICSGAAIMIKQTAAVFLLCLLGFLVWRRRFAEAWTFLAGSLLCPLLYALFFGLRGDLPGLIDALFLLGAGMIKFDLLNILIKTLSIFLFENSVLWILALVGLLYAFRQRAIARMQLLLAWGAVSLLSAYLTSFGLGHYFLPQVPALALLGGLALGNWPEIIRRQSTRLVALLLITALAFFTLISQLEFYLACSGDQIAAQRYGSEAISKFKRLGRLIGERTKPGDQVYGFPVAVYYSQRRQPIKYYIIVRGGRSEVRLLGKLLYAYDFGISRSPELTRRIDEDIYQAIADRRTKYLVFGLMDLYQPPRLKEVVNANGYVYDRELSDPDALIVIYKR
jgi:4-amino-4-deoxy-L-arabinose transferase-like glycosyltransferase